MSLFCCPICSAGLTRGERVSSCPRGHTFDIASSGYVHLLPPNQKHAKHPGDDKEMVAARAAFLEKGYYSALLSALQSKAAELLAPTASPVLIDSGCGEGYYTEGLFRALTQAGHTAKAAGVDISKFALKRAAKRLKEGEFSVASAYHLPLPDGCADLLTNIFSPLAAKEFLRILKPEGYFLYTVPSALHLWELKALLYDVPYENPVRQENYPGFLWLGAIPVRAAITLDSREDLMALFHMTPYAWKTPKAGIARLREQSSLKTQIGFDVHIYQKISVPSKDFLR